MLLRPCLFWVKNHYGKYFTLNRVFVWTGKYGQTEINFGLTVKFLPLQCKIIYTPILPSAKLPSYFPAFTQTEREREREREALAEILSSVFFDVYTYFPLIILRANQTLYQDICVTCQNICYYKLANPLTKHTLLVIELIQNGFSTSRNNNSSLVLKPCKFVQETSEEVLFIKA